MPVHRGGEERLYGLKTVVVVPGNSARGLDPHQGTVTLFEGETGQTVAVMNASPITAIRTAAASALATRELARKDARTLAIGAGFQAKAHRSARRSAHVRRHSHRLEDGGEDRGAGRATSGGTRSGVRRGGHTRRRRDHHRDELRGARRRSRRWQTEPTSTRSARASRTHASWTRPRSPPRHSSPTAASLQRTSRATTAWPSRKARSRTITSQRSWATCSSARTRPHVGGRDHGLRVAGRRGRGPLRRRVRRTPRAGAAAASPQTLIPIDEIRRAADVIAGGALRTPLVRAQLPDAPCELWLKLECLQPVGAFKIRGALNAIRQAPAAALAAGVVTPSAGNMGQAIACGRPATQASAPRSSPPTTPRARGSHRGHRQCRSSDGGRVAVRGYDEFCPPRGRTRHGGQRHDRAGDHR